MTGRSTAAIALGVVAALVGVVLILGGMQPMGEYRDADGFYMSDPFVVERPPYAVVSGDVDLLRGRWRTMIEDSIVLGFVDDPNDVRMQGAASGPGALFMGIAPASAVDEYLSGVAHDEVTDWDSNIAAMADIEYTTHRGTAPQGPPGTETFWVASVAGTGPQTLDWTIESGAWTTVIMNADASVGVTAEISLGTAPSSDLQATARTAVAFGAGALIVGGLLLYVGVSGRAR